MGGGHDFLSLDLSPCCLTSPSRPQLPLALLRRALLHLGSEFCEHLGAGWEHCLSQLAPP